MVPANSHKVPLASCYSGYCHLIYLTITGLSPSLVGFPSPFIFSILNLCSPSTPHLKSTVWALPRSLATTYGIIIIFSSYRYLDVSVPCVRSSFEVVLRLGCPIRISTDQFALANPRSFSQLITSFFASESLGIPRAPLFTYSYFR